MYNNRLVGAKITKIIYVVLFVVLILYPHLVVGHIFSIPSAYIQSIINVVIILIVGGIYWLHSRELKQKDLEKNIVKSRLRTSGKKLNGAFKYIGSVNRQLPLVINLTTDLFVDFEPNKKNKKNIIHKLLKTVAVSIAKVDWAIFRFIDSNSQRTIKEFSFTRKDYDISKTKISNHKLIKIKQGNSKTKEIDDIKFMNTTDNKAKIQCFLILPNTSIPITDISILQAIVDQAQIFYQYLFSYKECESITEG